MKILYIHQYFKTPQDGGCIRSYYLAKGLVDRGHKVELVTGYNGSKYIKKNVAGIQIHYLPVFYDNHLKFIGRVFSFLKFVILACRQSRRLKDVDVCYAMSAPLTVGLIAIYVKKHLQIPYYLEIGDLWPEAPVQMEVIKNRILKRVLYWFERKVYISAKKIIALSPGIRDGILSVTPEKEVLVIPNMSDCNFFKLESKNPLLEEAFELKNKFVISYFGAVGKANHLDYLVEAAEVSHKNNLNVQFLVAGYGSETKKIQHLITSKGLQNIRFIPYQNKEGLRKLLNITDAVYISYANKPVLQTGSPNKFFDGIAAGKMIITNTGGWIKNIIEQNKCGFYYNPNNPEGFVSRLIPYLNRKDLLLDNQQNARIIAEKQYSRELQIKKLLKIFSHTTKITEGPVYTLTG